MQDVGRKRTSKNQRLEGLDGLYFNEDRGYFFRNTRGNREFRHIGKVTREQAIRKWLDFTSSEVAGGTVAELIERYEREILPEKKGRTHDEYERQIAKLKERFGKRRYATTEVQAASGEFLRRMDINLFLREATAKKMANRDVTLLNQIFEHGRDCGLTEYNPCTGVKKNAETPRDRLPTHSDYAKFKHAAQPVVRLMMLMSRLTGMREGNLLTLLKPTSSAKWLEYRQNKGGRLRKIAITRSIALVLKAADGLPGHLKSMYVFHNRKGLPYTQSGFQSLWQRTRKKSGVLDVHFHDFRAKAGTDADERGQDAQKLLGHRDKRTTERVYMRGAQKVQPIK